MKVSRCLVSMGALPRAVALGDEHMRNSLIPLVAMLLLVMVNFQLAAQVVDATTSETFPLALYTPIIRNVELQKNDHLVGDFTITNIPTWTNIMGQVQGYSCSVTIFDPNGQVVLRYTNTKGASFDYTAFYSGIYKIQFDVGSEYYPPSGVGNPMATLNYSVLASSSFEPSFFGNLPLWLVLAITVCIGAIAIGITAGVYLTFKRKSNASARASACCPRYWNPNEAF